MIPNSELMCLVSTEHLFSTISSRILVIFGRRMIPRCNDSHKKKLFFNARFEKNLKRYSDLHSNVQFYIKFMIQLVIQKSFALYLGNTLYSELYQVMKVAEMVK